MKLRNIIALIAILTLPLLSFGQEKVLEIYHKKKKNKTFVIDHDRDVFFKTRNVANKQFQVARYKLDYIQGDTIYFIPVSGNHKPIEKSIKRIWKIKLRTGASVAGTLANTLLTGGGQEALQEFYVNRSTWGIRVIDKPD